MKLYHTEEGIFLENENNFYLVDNDWDSLVIQEDLSNILKQYINTATSIPKEKFENLFLTKLLPPIGSQNVWAAGVTYFRSRKARMEESADSGGADFYEKVYEADRPELFFKASADQVVGHGGIVNIRRDSSWDVPEPELTVLLSPSGNINGYTIGNDMSSRSIEGENPLYLPQAKMYDKSAAIGPCLLVQHTHLSEETEISLEISREGNIQFSEKTTLQQMKRTVSEIASWLFRENSFARGCYLMTGTGIVPDNFTLTIDDIIRISIEGIGTLENKVSKKDN